MSFSRNNIIKIKVLASGEILADDDVSVSMDDLSKKLHHIKSLDGAVWYYRENSGHIPNEVADEAFSKILNMKIAVSLSSQPDFSDWIDSNGESHPRDENGERTENENENENGPGHSEGTG